MTIRKVDVVKKILIAVIALLVIFTLTGAACAPYPPPTDTSPQLTKFAYLDSLGVQMNELEAVQNAEQQGRQWNAKDGADLFYWADEVKKIASEDPEEITLALGANDVSGCNPVDPGWSQNDALLWSETLNLIPETTTVVLVLPYMTQAIDWWCNGSFDQLPLARKDLISMASIHPNVVIADWAVIAEAHPEYISDGVHMASEEAMMARYDMIINAGG